MQIKHFVNVENGYTASHYEITLQQKIGWLENVIQKGWCTKGLMAGIQLESQWREVYMR